MGINKNHEFEELNGVKCAVVEKNVSKERTAFLTELLQHNGYTVVTVPSPPPKTAAPVAAPAEGEIAAPAIPTPETFTVGVTNAAFNAVNAVFGRMLKTKEGTIVTQDYWLQKETISSDQIPYFSTDENITAWK
jgi:hypothetical protein